MNRKQARLARQAEKLLKQAEKSARLKERPIEMKQVRVGADPNSVFGMKMTWTHEAYDREGAWTWGVNREWAPEDWETIIKPKLENWANLTWGEIDGHSSDTGHKLHHTMQTDAICDEAQYRMVAIEKYSDIVFRFRLGNKRRLWGFRTIAHFEILWFDPTHQIYPTEPD